VARAGSGAWLLTFAAIAVAAGTASLGWRRVWALSPDAVNYAAAAHALAEGRGLVAPVQYSYFLAGATPPLPAIHVFAPVFPLLDRRDTTARALPGDPAVVRLAALGRTPAPRAPVTERGPPLEGDAEALARRFSSGACRSRHRCVTDPAYSTFMAESSWPSLHGRVFMAES